MKNFFLEVGGLLVEFLLELGVLLIKVLLGLLYNHKFAHILSVFFSEVLQRIRTHLPHFKILNKIIFDVSILPINCPTTQSRPNSFKPPPPPHSSANLQTNHFLAYESFRVALPNWVSLRADNALPALNSSSYSMKAKFLGANRTSLIEK